MRIAVDVRELCGRATGVGRYLDGLLQAWSDDPAASRHEWMLYAHARPSLPGRWRDGFRLLRGAGGTWWEQGVFARALRADRPDVLFAPGYTAPLTVGAPLVLTIHDVSYFAHPEWFTAREGLRKRLITAWSARRARAVITDSEFSRSEIVKHIGIPAATVRAIHLGLHGGPDGSPPNPTAGREPLVLFVGSIFERRHVDRLIAAFDRAAGRVPGASLHIVGENRTRRPHQDLEALRARQVHATRIHLRAYVDDAELASLYGRASVFVFLSQYEGFGLPPLEALAAGAAPVLLDTPIAREICGPAARYVAPAAGTDDIADVITDLLTSPEARARVMAQARPVLARYDWKRAAAATLTVIEEAALGR